MADYLSTYVQTARKTSPDIHGMFAGTLHIEPDGTVRMFAADDSGILNEGDSQIVESLVLAMFGKKIKFPELGANVLLHISVRINKAD